MNAVLLRLMSKVLCKVNLKMKKLRENCGSGCMGPSLTRTNIERTVEVDAWVQVSLEQTLRELWKWMPGPKSH